MSELLGLLVFSAVPAYFVLQPWALTALRSGWRLAAAIPLGFAVPAAIWCLYALAQDSNLWPLVFIFFAPIGTLYLAALIYLNRILSSEI